MAIRTTAEAVGKLIEVDSSLDITAFIATATKTVDWLASKDVDGELDSETLERIEAWLSAHYYAVNDQQYSSKSTDGASATFQGQTGMALDATYWGQMAKVLDTTGRLSDLGKPKNRASITWLGTERC